MRRGAQVVLLAWCVTLLGGWAAGPAAAPPTDPVEARAFEVQFKALADAADVLASLLSEDGTLTLRPRVNVLVIEDRRSVLERAAQVLDSWDLPPQNVEITLSLFLGQRRKDLDEERSPRPAGGTLSQEVRGVMETLSDFTQWTSYEPLGSRAVTGIEGERMEADLSSEYRVIFVVGSVHDGKGVVKFDTFTLQRLEQLPDEGREFRDMYTTGMVLSTGRLHVVGAARDPRSQRALFLTLQVETR